MINDPVFGALEYDYIWFRNIDVLFFDKKNTISLMISGDDEGIFEKEQYEAYTSIMEKLSNLDGEILEFVFDYYRKERHQLGYDVEDNENYPLIERKEDLVDKVSIVGLIVPYSGTYEGREIGLTFDCTWDDENGIGVYLLDEKVFKVGYQDIVM